MNTISIGLYAEIELPKNGYLYIGDEVPDVPRARIFDITKHTFNPLKAITDKTARELSDVLYTISPQGENTLTVRNGRRGLLQAFLKAKRLDKVAGDEEVMGMIDDILASSVVKKVVCGTDNVFSFNPQSVVLVRLNRKELGDFACLVLGFFIMMQYKGQIVIEDFGFYGRDGHVALINEERLIAKVNFLDELSKNLQKSVLLIEEKIARGALFDDAQVLAKFAGLAPGTNGFNDFVLDAMGH